MNLGVGFLTVNVVLESHGCLVKLNPATPQSLKGAPSAPALTSTAFSHTESLGGLICFLCGPTHTQITK